MTHRPDRHSARAAAGGTSSRSAARIRISPCSTSAKGLKGKDQVLLDPHPMSPDHTVSHTLLDISEDGKPVAYWIRTGRRDEVDDQAAGCRSRKELAGTLPAAATSASRSRPMQSRLLQHATKRGPRVYRHGRPPAVTDGEIFGEGYGPEKGIGVRVSEDGRYLLIQVSEGSARRIRDLGAGSEARRAARPIVNDIAAGSAGDRRRHALPQTNWKRPERPRHRGRSAQPRARALARAHPGKQDRHRRFFRLAGQPFVRTTWITSPRAWSSSPPMASASARSRFRRWEQSETSMRRWAARSLLRVRFVPHPAGRSTAMTPVRANERSGGGQCPRSKPENFELKQVWYNSKDGTKIPMFLLHRKGLKLDGKHPAFLTGYGGFNVSLTPAFSATRCCGPKTAACSRSPTCAAAASSARSGTRPACSRRSRTCSTISSARPSGLSRRAIRSPARLGISGRSNGGLLMGAAITQRPDLFGAVVCGYPLLDMVRYDQFLVARWWVPEYGSRRRPRAIQVHPCVLAVSPRAAGHEIPGRAVCHRRRRYARRPAARAQNGRAAAGIHGFGPPVLLRYDTKSGHSAACR